ncbi:MAG: chromate transporter [Akkermansiaceae bacterium]
MNDSGPLAGIYRAGSLVFGGGHVVLPLLQESMVDGGYMSNEVFLGGYGATQAVPGPVFTFAAFLGVKAEIFGNPWLGAGTSLIAIFLPGMLLLGGTMRIWGRLRSKRWAQRAVNGANAGVVGVLGVALLRMATDQSTLAGWIDFGCVAIFFLILQKKNHPSLGSCHHLSYGRCSYRLEAPEMLAFREFSVHLPRPAKKSRFCHGKDSLSESLGCSHSGNPERWTHTTLYRNSPHSRGHQSAGLRDAP